MRIGCRQPGHTRRSGCNTRSRSARARADLLAIPHLQQGSLNPTRAPVQTASFANLVATSESWTDKNTGERVEKTEWHRVVILNNDGLCKLVQRCLARGSKVYVEGQIRTRKWTDREGVERYGTEIHITPYNGAITFLDSRREGDERAPSRQPATTGAGGSTGADLDDDVPFGSCWQ